MNPQVEPKGSSPTPGASNVDSPNIVKYRKSENCNSRISIITPITLHTRMKMKSI
jgi:hypothetical protein